MDFIIFIILFCEIDAQRKMPKLYFRYEYENGDAFDAHGASLLSPHSLLISPLQCVPEKSYVAFSFLSFPFWEL